MSRKLLLLFILSIVVSVNAGLFSDLLENLWLKNDFSRIDDTRELKVKYRNRRQTTEDLIKNAGYTVETHQVESDGFLLTLHRIPKPSKEPVKLHKPVVILQHGLLGSSAIWVLHKNALGFLLADEGYDVWIPNVRGNTYSKVNRIYHPINDSDVFWDFSFHEMGAKDMPLIIDYILDSTGESQLFYVGHSMGTTIVYTMLSVRPEYNSKIKLFATMAPIAYLSNMGSIPVQIMLIFDKQIKNFMKKNKIYEVFPQNPFIDQFDQNLCLNCTLTYNITVTVIKMLTGFDPDQINLEILQNILIHFLAGASLKTLEHFSQLMRGNKFCQFDYGWPNNVRHYGSAAPPVYNLSKVVAPNLIFHSRNDLLSSRQDVLRLYTELPNVIGMEIIRYRKFKHLDYILAKDLKHFVYNTLIDIFNSYSDNQFENKNKININ